MRLNYAAVYLEINEGEGTLTSRIADAMRKYNISTSPKSFTRMYHAWCKNNNIAKNNTQVVGQIDKGKSPLLNLETKLNGFSSLLDELKPSESNPLDLPPSQESNYKPFKLPVNHNDILLMSDIHVPYHNIQALTLALKYGLENEVNTILLNGDIIDFYAISRFEKDPRKRNFGHEVLMTRQFLQTLRKLFPNAAIYYKCGNHDVRYDHYIMRNAPD